MVDVLKKIKESSSLNFEFELYEKGVAKVTGLNGFYVFVEYIEEDDTFLVFDGGFTVTECLDNFGDTDEIVEKVKRVLTKYKVNKEEESLFLECTKENLGENIQKLINAENEILYK